MESIELAVSGMSCGGCVNSVTRVLRGLDGVAEVDVSLERGAARVGYDPAKVQPAQMKAAVEGAGFGCSA